MPHVPGGSGGPVPLVANGAAFGSRNRSKPRLVISRPPLILNMRLLTAGLDPLNLLVLLGDATHSESIAVTKVTEGLEVRLAQIPAVAGPHRA
jgi:hypothetical protein